MLRPRGATDPLVLGDPAVPPATAQPGVRGRHAGQEPGGGGWPAEGAGDRGQEQQNGAAVLRAAGEADRMKVQVIMVPGESPV